MTTSAAVQALPVFDVRAMHEAVDRQRTTAELSWYDLAGVLWEQSSDLNDQRDDHPLCGGAVSRQGGNTSISCQYALFMLRWIDQAPEEFLDGPTADVGDVRLPAAGPDSRLRFDLPALGNDLNAERQRRELTWADLGRQLDVTPARLTNLRTARQADMTLVLRVTQWLGRPAAAFIRPTDW